MDWTEGVEALGPRWLLRTCSESPGHGSGRARGLLSAPLVTTAPPLARVCS